MKSSIALFIIVFSMQLATAQYLESFNIPNKGILIGSNNTSFGCPGDYTTCLSYDFSGVDWIIGGNLTGVELEGLFTKSGYLHFLDVDEEACWIGPVLDISSVPSSSLNVNFSIPSGSAWESSSTVGSTDYMDVEYRVNGGAWVTIPNVNGCNASGHTVSGINCSGITGPQTFTPSVSGIVGNTLQIRVCVDLNASTDEGYLNSVAVPEGGTILLPVTWGDVMIESIKNTNLIKWQTLSEVNNDYFEVQKKSVDDKEFTTIGKIQGAGNSEILRNYEFEDRNPTEGINYYRLKQIDFNGRFEYSKIVSSKNRTDRSFTAFPNPLSRGSILYLDGIEGATEQIVQMTDTQGKLVFQKQFPPSILLEFPIPGEIPEGIYNISVQSKLNHHNLRIVIQ